MIDCLSLLHALASGQGALTPQVIINEIYYDPADARGDIEGVYPIRTRLSDMQGQYSTAYLRCPFQIKTAQEMPETLALRLFVDDDCIVWINGAEVVRHGVSGGPLTVTAKVTNPQGVTQVSLSYQVVQPGHYIPAWLPVPLDELKINASAPKRKNPEFHDPANWTSFSMTDDGAGSDVTAFDEVFTAVIPGQPNRTLIRYRITAIDAAGEPPAVTCRTATTHPPTLPAGSTDRWSHWSSLVEFVAGPSPGPDSEKRAIVRNKS